MVRAGFGMYNDLQDALGYRMDQNAPFNPAYSIANALVSSLPIDPAAPVPAGAKLVPGGVQPNLKSPTLISWSLRVQRELSPNTSLTVGLRWLARLSRNYRPRCERAVPDDLSRVALPRGLSDGKSFHSGHDGFLAGSPLAGAPVPAGSYYIPSGTPKPTPSLANTWTWFSLGDSNYNALQMDVNHRFSHGFFAARRLHLVESAG